MPTPSLTAVVLTLNEERHLPECLASLALLTDNVVVIDSGSSDRTQSIARESGAMVVEREFRGYASQRNTALGMATAEWVLFLDADERLTPDLAHELRNRIANADPSLAGFLIPRRNLVCGHALQGGGWWPDHQARVINRGRGRYDPQREVHEVVQFEGPTATLAHPLVHINYESWGEVLKKQRDYTIRQVRAGLVPAPGPISYLSRPAREMFRRFVSLRGYRDGRTGLLLALVMALEEFRGCLLARHRGAT